MERIIFNKFIGVLHLAIGLAFSVYGALLLMGIAPFRLGGEQEAMRIIFGAVVLIYGLYRIGSTVMKFRNTEGE
ncbi:MAG: hypothetical protein GF315_07975 [candidate division Zixibacteria bacterium]|nr:hypothetical protein [candidate division Zixibacteria bacterium]